MTRCRHCSYNYQLKSSAYNSTGECLEVQLSTYNAMANHLRRILTAKSVVDSGKTDKRLPTRRDAKLQKAKTATGMRHQRLDADPNSKVSHSLSHNDIDRLVYDTKHHPNDVANLTYRRSKHRMTSRSNSTDSSDDSVLRGHRGALRYYGNKRMNDEFEDINQKFGKSDWQVYLPRVKSSSEEIPDFIASVLYGTRSTSNIADYADLTMRPRTYQDAVNPMGNKDSSMYVTFVYDITKEVMERGLYDDSEIEDVFRRHFNRNLGTLNKRKMNREISQLKRSLNMKCGSDEDEEETEEDESASRCSNKMIEKRETPSKPRGSPPGCPAMRENKEHPSPKEMLVVTKEDILTTLLEMDLNPEKARKICDSLENRSSPGIPRMENRLPDGNGLQENGEAEKKLDNPARPESAGNIRSEIEPEDEKENKLTESTCDSGSDSEYSCIEELSGSGSSNKDSETTDALQVVETLEEKT